MTTKDKCHAQRKISRSAFRREIRKNLDQGSDSGEPQTESSVYRLGSVSSFLSRSGPSTKTGNYSIPWMTCTMLLRTAYSTRSLTEWSWSLRMMFER